MRQFRPNRSTSPTRCPASWMTLRSTGGRPRHLLTRWRSPPNERVSCWRGRAGARRAVARVDGMVAMDRMPGEWLWPGRRSRLLGRLLAGISRLTPWIASADRWWKRSGSVKSAPGAGRRLRATPAHRRRDQGSFTGDQRSDHRRPRSRKQFRAALRLRRPPSGPTVHRDHDGKARVVILRPGFGDLLELAVAQPWRYGAADAQVQAGLLRLLRDLAWRTSAPGAQVRRSSCNCADPAGRCPARISMRWNAIILSVWRRPSMRRSRAGGRRFPAGVASRTQPGIR